MDHQRTCSVADNNALKYKVCFGLFNGISTSERLFNAEIWLISKCLITVITIYIFNIPLQSFFSITLFLFDYNNHLYAQLYGIKYSNLILIIYAQLLKVFEETISI